MVSSSNPISAQLEDDLRAELSRHHVVVWLDGDDHYSTFVDTLAARTQPPFPAPIVALRGSYLELMIALEEHASGADKSPLLVHLPGVTRQTVKDTPALEVYSNGYCKLENLESLLRKVAAGRVPPDEVEAFIAAETARPPGKLSLEGSDTWMASKVAAATGELAARLQGVKIGAIVDDLIRGGPISTCLKESGDYGAIWRHLAAHVGLRDDWPIPTRRDVAPDPQKVADALMSWALCVEYVHDLRRPTEAALLAGLKRLSPPLVEACGEAAKHLRRTAPDAYAALALDVERLIDAERGAGTPADLGKIDTFRFEEEQLYAGAIEALATAQWAQALEWADGRLAGKSFWLEHDFTRKSAWMLVRVAAELGLAVESAALEYSTAHSLAEGTQLYAEHGAPIDRLHRHFEQSCDARLYHRVVPRFEALRAALGTARDVYSQWADAMARGWTMLCEREGVLPPADQQQRRIFEDVVRPLLEDGEKTALVVVDGLRFEMAQELLEQIGKPAASSVHLRPWLAELPSVTEIGMNVLAPVADGNRLRPMLDKKARKFAGFQNAAFRVNNPESRRKAMAHRAGGHACPFFPLPELLSMPAEELRASLKRARLLVVHSVEIDAAGEKGSGLPVFAGAIRKLHAVWKRLRDVGVQRFVFTSDHGFLLRTPQDPSLVHGQGYDAMPRYALYPANVPSPDQLAVPLRALQYEDVEGMLLFPRGLEVYC